MMKVVSTPITSEQALHDLIGEPTDLVRANVSDRVDELTRRFIDLSPFMLLEPLAVDRKTPGLGVLIDVDEVFTHCSKAFIPSGLSDAGHHVDRGELPTSGEIHRSLNPSFDAAPYDKERAGCSARREGLY